MINILIVLSVLAAVLVFVALRCENQPKPEELVKNKCGCGKSQDPDGYCDGSHANSDKVI